MTAPRSTAMGVAMTFLARPFLFAIDAERAHGLTIDGLAAWGAAGTPLAKRAPSLPVTVAGIDFPNPLGLAAGADKDARAVDGFLGLGFGSVEVGTLTPLPQAGNPKPRLFRLVEDRAVINRMGFNNGGLAAAHRRLIALDDAGRRSRRGIVGVNVGPNKDTLDRIHDFLQGVTAMSGVADYITLNVSSPNTPGLRDMQGGGELQALLAAVADSRTDGDPPIFLKVAPDQEPAQIDAIARAAIDHGIDALIVGNTTISRPALASRNAGEAGGLSGAPLASLAAQRLADFRTATGGQLTLVAAGGIDSGAAAYARIRAGASLVQLYTALVYKGPGLPLRILRELESLLARDGFATIADAVGQKGA